jgi:exonuclease SbcC
MKLRSLHLTNFRQHADTRVEFGDGLTGIIGANGSGKSTILEAVSFALFGVEATRGTKDTLRWKGATAARQVQVGLTFAAGGVEYSLSRSETGAELEVYGRAVAHGTTAVIGKVVELLGMTYREFAATYLCAQKDLSRLASLGPAERATFFRRVMGVERLDLAVKAAREERNRLKIERDALSAWLGDREPLVEAVDGACAAVELAVSRRGAAADGARVASISASAARGALLVSHAVRAEHEALRHAVEQARVTQQGLEGAQGRLRTRLTAASLAAERVAAVWPEVAEMPALAARRDDLLALRAVHRDRQTTQGALAEAEEHLAHAAEIAALADPAYLERCRLALGDAVAAHAGLKGDRLARGRAAFAERAEAAAQAARCEARAQALEEAQGALCPTCAQPLGGRLAEVVARIRAEQAEAEARAAELAVCWEESAEELAAAREATRRAAEYSQALQDEEGASAASFERDRRAAQVARLQQQIAALPVADYDEAEYQRVVERVGDVGAVAESIRADQVVAATRAGLQTDFAAVEESIESARSAAASAVAQMDALGFDAAAHAGLESAAREAEEANEDARVALARAEEALKGAQQAQARAARALEDYDNRAGLLAALTERLRVGAAAAEALDAFRTAQVAGIRPEMEELVSGFVQILSDGRFSSVSLDESFGLTLHRDGLPYEVISGGEEDVAAIAMRLATSQMIAERAGQQVNLLVLDEPFGSLSEVRRGNVLRLVRRLGGIFEQVILISHVPEVQHAVDHAVLLEVDEARGCSVVTVYAGAAA